MADIINILESRRSVRKFSSQKVEKEKLDLLMRAALLAPTGRNAQPLFFVILQNERKKEELYERIPGLRECYYGADSILFCLIRTEDHLNELNAGAACQNVLLEAESIGVATCWNHRGRKLLDTEEGRKALKEVLELSQEYVPSETVAIGYLDGEKPAMKDRRIDGCKIL